MNRMKNEVNKNRSIVYVPDTPLGTIACEHSQVGLTGLKFFTDPLPQREGDGKSDWIFRIDQQIRDYFSRKLISFDLPIDLSAASAFQTNVLIACCEIPFGEVVSYGELAKRVGKPGGAQAVGGVMARNPIPLIIPCHRVVAADGRLHGYSAQGGLETKTRLLIFEGVQILNQTVIKEK